MTFADIVAKSSNVGTIMAARDLGRDRLYQAEVDFGYGRRSGVDLPGSRPGSCARPRTGTAPTSGPTPSARAWP